MPYVRHASTARQKPCSRRLWGREPMESSEARPGRLRVGVVGAGRVGAALGAALERAGHTVVAASGVSAESRRRAERMLPDVPLTAPQDVLAASELVLLTVP